ncbi:hypothetical protein BV898_02873 [Hypsibius exemplaris]|uniref:Uncharacterized protein n=1 Tax=Hypsibius exemplaris TaxID=2072580 RepID=A0A1W0X6W1_HYPEX|nr:hypothetical protein BV898_02873 [Hypsibius exemplaris]
MYNGVGLDTNGYVQQRTMAFVKPSKDKVTYLTEEEIAKSSEVLLNRKPNLEVLELERKRKVMEAQDNYSPAAAPLSDVDPAPAVVALVVEPQASSLGSTIAAAFVVPPVSLEKVLQPDSDQANLKGKCSIDLPAKTPQNGSAREEDCHMESSSEPGEGSSGETGELPLERQSLTSLLSALTPSETELFDDLMDSMVNVISNDLLTDEMSDGHRPTEPTPVEIDGMVNTWEDLFQNPFEYMLHSLESCPNCGRMIALSRMAPHIVSACGQNRSNGSKKKRKGGHAGGDLFVAARQTRSAAVVAGKRGTPNSSHTPAVPPSSQDSFFASSSLSQEVTTATSSQSQANCSSLDLSKPLPVDPQRMAGLESTIGRLKRRTCMETPAGGVKRRDDGGGEGGIGSTPEIFGIGAPLPSTSAE